MFVRAFLAGAYIAMGAALATVGSTGVADVLGAGIAQFILGALFPIGLVLVVLTGAELFTGDAMFAPMAVLQGHTGLKGLIYLWIVVYIGNLIGSLFMAFLVSYGPYTAWDAAGVATATAFGTRAIAIATAKVSYFGPMGSARWVSSRSSSRVFFVTGLCALLCSSVLQPMKLFPRSLQSGSQSWLSLPPDLNTVLQTCTSSRQVSSQT